MADLYYSGTQGDSYYKAPSGIIEGDLKLKRKFLYNEDNNIEKYFDEGINEIILKSVDENNENALIDEFLKVNLEESTGKKLKEVVATIQKEQNEIIRADKNFPIIIQGSAGSGKTTVALHRLAYLLYRYKESITGKDILVIAPNKLFLDYISEVLPNLGVELVLQKTFDELAIEALNIKGKLITKDKKLIKILEKDNNELDLKYIKNTSKLKGSLGFKEILNRYIKVLEKDDSNIEDITIKGYKLFDSKEIKCLFLKDLVKYPLNKRKDEIKRYFEKKLGDKLFEILDKVDFKYEYSIARTKKLIENEQERRKEIIRIYSERDNEKEIIKKEGKKEFNEYFEHWKGINTENIYIELFKNEEIFKLVTADKIPKKLYKYIKDELIYNSENNIIDCDDLAAMLYLKYKIDGIKESSLVKHIVVDEAQDYSPLQLEVVSMLSLGKSLTMVGDIGQGIYSYKGINDWKTIMLNIFQNKGIYKSLTQSYRSTVEIIDFANKVLMKQENYPKPALPVLRHGDEPSLVKFKNGKDFCIKLDEIVEDIYSKNKRSIAIIGKTFNECKKIRDIVRKYSKYDFKLIKDDDKALDLDLIIIPSYLTKGLEFDCSIVYNLNDSNYKNIDMDKKLLYVVLTRALHKEFIFYNGNISRLLK